MGAGLLLRRAVTGVVVVLLALVLAAVLVFADPVSPAWGYPLLALATIAGYASFAGRQLPPLVLAVAVVMALLPTAGVASYLGRENDAELYGSCAAPVAAFFLPEGGVGWEPPAAATGPTQIFEISESQLSRAFSGPCTRLAGRRLATALVLASLAALFYVARSRRSASDFRVRSYH